MIQAFVLDLLVLLAFFVTGYQLLQILLPPSDSLERIAYAYPLGAGVFTWCLFLISWAGIPLTRLSLFLLFCLLMVASRVIPSLLARESQPRSHWFSFPRRLPLDDKGRGFKAIWVIIGLLTLLTFAYSVGRSYGEAYDAIAIWANQGYGIAHENSIFAGQEWGWWGLSYPLNLMLQVSTFMLFGGELLPGSKLMYPVYLISLCLACYAFWMKSGVHKTLATLGVLFIATNPVVFNQSTNGYSNLPFAVIYSIGVLVLIDGVEKQDKSRQLLAGIFLGLAAWTRPEGIGYSLVTLVLLGVLNRITRNGKVYLPHLALPVVIIVGPWLLFGWKNVVDVELPLGAAIASVFPNIISGNLNLFELYRIPRFFLDRALKPENWGAFIPIVATLFILGLITRNAWRQTRNFYLASMALLASSIPVAIYYVVSFEPFDNYLLILRRDFDRAFLSGFTLLTVLAINLWGGDVRTRPKMALSLYKKIGA
jgi:hypothetical protein